MIRRLPISLLLIALTAAAGRAAEDTADIPEEIVNKVDPSVVAIQHERASGSGFVISADGYLLSNGHVVAGNNTDDPTEPAKAITVVLHDETKYSAKVLGFSLNPDVALLKIEPREPLIPVEFADVSKVQIGQPCFAVGTPYGLKRTFSKGILSNVDRTDLGTFTKVFQTDAAINPGNSGGPLFDREGRVLGLNTYASRGANNLGFTIPINYALEMKDDFREHGRFIRADLPTFFAGELYEELQQALGVEDGLLIHHVEKGSPAWTAGLRAGDVLTHINDEAVSAHNKVEMLEENWAFTTREPGEEIVLTVERGAPGETETLKLEATLVESEPVMSTNRFKGEIVTSRIDALGLTYKPLVTMHRLAYRLADTAGVLVEKPDSASAALRAGLRERDIISAVEGVPVATVEDLERELLTRLREGLNYIELEVWRGKNATPTALRPYYDLRDTTVLVVLPAGLSEGFERIARELIADGATVRVAAPGGTTATPIPEGLPQPVKIESVDTNSFDRLFLVDGEEAEALHRDEAVLALVRATSDADKIIAAEGASALAIPAASEDLRDTKITTRRALSSRVAELEGVYTGQEVESDGKILTSAGDGDDTTRDFLKKHRAMR